MSVLLDHSEGLIQDFVDVTIDVMAKMAFFEVRKKDAYDVNSVCDGLRVTTCYDITGILGFSGDRTGSMVLTLSRELALTAVGGMLGTNLSKIDAVVRDGVGELVNIIAGGAKTRLQKKGIDFVLSIPHTVVGPNHQITAPASTQHTRIDFTTATGDFFIEIFVKSLNHES